MPIQATRRVAAVSAAAVALLLAALAAAPQASAATLYACVKKNGSAHIYAKKPKCKKHESKLSWNTEGIAGKNGLNGLNGTNGKNGTNGADGKEGPRGLPGPFTESLPSGMSETGVWGALQNGKAGSVYAPALSFPIPLTKAPTAHYIAAGETPPSGCSGTVLAPVAAPGNLCVFETFKPINLTHLDFYAPESATESATAAGKTGALVVFSATAEGTQQAVGTFAVTE